MGADELPRLSGEVWSTWRAAGAVTRVTDWMQASGPAVVQTVIDFANRVGNGGLRTLWHAVGQLGPAHACEVAIAARLRPDQPGAELAVTWRHAVATAAWARVIATSRHRDPYSVFLGGLLHDIGRLARLRTEADGSERALAAAIERSWRLPAPVAACVRHHRRFQRAPSFRDEVATVHLASRLAAGDSVGGSPALRWLGLGDGDLQALLRRIGVVDAYVEALTAPMSPCT